MQFNYMNSSEPALYNPDASFMGTLDDFVNSERTSSNGHASNIGYSFIPIDELRYLMIEFYFNNRDYEEQQQEQIWDFDRNSAIMKRVHVHNSADDMGAYGFTTLTDANLVLNTHNQFEDMGRRLEVLLHEQHHGPDEYDTRKTISEMLKFQPVQGVKYITAFRPGV